MEITVLKNMIEDAEKQIDEYLDMQEYFSANPFQEDISYWTGYRKGLINFWEKLEKTI